jgi:hypothetical protein
MAVRSPLTQWGRRLLSWIRSKLRACDARARGSSTPVPSLLLRTRLNGRDSWLPLRVDASGTHTEIWEAGQLVGDAEGVEASLLSTHLVAAQIWLPECPQSLVARDRIASMAKELLQIGMEAVPGRCMPLGCIPALDVRHHGAGRVEVILYSECADAIGQSAIEASARAIAAPIARLVGCKGNPRIQVGVLDALRARVRSRLDLRKLGGHRPSPNDSADATLVTALDELLRWFGFDTYHPQIAAGHNDYVLGASMAAAAVLGLEPWRIGYAARSHTMRWGSCEPLARWRRRGNDLLGHLEMPVDLESARRALPPGAAGVRDELSERRTAGDLLLQVAGVGLTASLAYLRLALAADLRLRSGRSALAAATGAAEPGS